MTSPPSTFISFWRFPARRLGLERHFSSPSRLTGWEEEESQHSFTCCQTQMLLTPPTPPSHPCCPGQPDGESPSWVPLTADATPGEAKGKHPSFLNSQFSVMRPHMQALPPSLHPSRERNRDPKQQDSALELGLPHEPMNLLENRPQQGGHGSLVPSLHLCPPLLDHVGTQRGFPHPLCLPHCPSHMPAHSGHSCAKQSQLLAPDVHGALCRRPSTTLGEYPRHMQSTAMAPDRPVVSTALPGAARTPLTSDSLRNCCSAQKTS